MMSKKNKSAILAFVPVIHSGYVDFFNKNDGDILVLDDELVQSYVHLTRDLRLLPARKITTALKSVLTNRKIATVGKKQLASFRYGHIIMPDDEVCRDIAIKYLKNKELSFVSVFLRWNRVITLKENVVSEGRKITEEVFHRKVIDKAFTLAQKSSDWWRQISCLVMKSGKVVISTYNHHLPTDFHLAMNGDPRSNFDAGQHQEVYTSIHAEAEAIAIAAKKGISLKGTTFYSTTFPCPNCARLIGTAGVKKVYYSKGYSLLDAERILDHFGVEVILVQ